MAGNYHYPYIICKNHKIWRLDQVIPQHNAMTVNELHGGRGADGSIPGFTHVDEVIAAVVDAKGGAARGVVIVVAVAVPVILQPRVVGTP